MTLTYINDHRLFPDCGDISRQVCNGHDVLMFAEAQSYLGQGKLEKAGFDLSEIQDRLLLPDFPKLAEAAGYREDKYEYKACRPDYVGFDVDPKTSAYFIK